MNLESGNALILRPCPSHLLSLAHYMALDRQVDATLQHRRSNDASLPPSLCNILGVVRSTAIWDCGFPGTREHRCVPVLNPSCGNLHVSDGRKGALETRRRCLRGVALSCADHTFPPWSPQSRSVKNRMRIGLGAPGWGCGENACASTRKGECGLCWIRHMGLCPL